MLQSQRAVAVKLICIMKSFMKSFWNFLKKNVLYASVNIIGLTISMAFVILLSIYLVRQFSTDSFQKNADRIYLIANDEGVSMGYWLDKHLKNNFPEIEKGCCVSYFGGAERFIIAGEPVYASTTAADSTFFDIFSYELVSGNVSDWHISWDRCMISEDFANAHFPDRDPVGQVIRWTAGEGYQLTICGVYRDFGNSILKTPDILFRGDILPKINIANDEYMSNAGGGVCFVMTHPGADLSLKQGEILDWLESNFWVYKKAYDKVRIIPLKDVYFLQDGTQDWTDTLTLGNRDLVNLLLSLCLVLVVFAVLNYVNLTTALNGFRAKEMAARRLVGADRKSIFFKIIMESTLICSVSMVLAVLLAEALAPVASEILAYRISVSSSISVASVSALVGFTILLGFISGFVPALIIQQVSPIEIVKGTLRRKTKTVYSKIIIVIQNEVSVIMLVAAMVIFLQIRHLVTADLGYNTEDVLIVENQFGVTSELNPLIDKWKSEPCVEAVGLGNGTPLSGTNNWTIELQDSRYVSFQQIIGDKSYFDILGIEEKQDNNIPDSYWLNEYAFSQLEIGEDKSEFITKGNSTIQIGGIYRDFKIRPLEQEQSAALIFKYKDFPQDGYPWSLLVKTNGNHREALARLEADAREVFPDMVFNAVYMDDEILAGYSDEQRILKIVLIFTVLLLSVSALGLFALSSYYMQQQVRSVSVKKVFGADLSLVLKELVWTFVRMTGVAFVFAVPVSWFLMHEWLSRYTHHIGLSWWIFVCVGLVVTVIAAVSVLFYSIKTARTSPVESLKKE